MRVRCVGRTLACAASMAASTALAQHELPLVSLKPPEAPVEAPSPPTEVAPVEVTATLSPAELKAVSYTFVKSYAAPTARLGQIPRWRAPVCVQVGGVSRTTADLIVTRLEPAARLTGQTLGRDGCSANVSIYFSDDPQGLVDNLAAQDERILGYYHHAEFNRLKTVNRPIQAWYMTATAGSGGPATGALLANVGRTRYSSEDLDDPESGAPTGCADSRITGCLESVFQSVLVVVDNRRTAKLNPELVGDYVAMLVFSEPNAQGGCNPLPSVVDLFADCSGRTKPQGLTSADRAYLTALYKANLEAKLPNEQSQIAEEMAATLVKAQSEKR